MIGLHDLTLTALAAGWGLPLVGLAFRFRSKNGRSGGEDDEMTMAARALVESSFSGILLLDAEGQIGWANEEFAALLGYRAGELEGKALVALVDPSEAERVHRHLSQAGTTPQSFEVQAIDQDGSIRTLRVSAAPIGDDNGRIVAGIADISEEDLLRRRVAFTEKINLLGRLMAGIGSDVRQALQGLEPLVEGSGSKPATESLSRLRDLNERISHFPIRGIKGADDVWVHEIVEEVTRAMMEDASIEVTHEMLADDGDLPPVLADAEQLKEALRQVLLNAVEAAASTGGKVEVTTRSLTLSRARSHREFILPPGEYAHITIADTGPGIPAAMIPHVFDPLFTTRGGNPLAGLGLAVSYGIIKNHRGYIDIESTQGEGTTVDVYLPRSRTREARAESPRASELFAAAAAERGEPLEYILESPVPGEEEAVTAEVPEEAEEPVVEAPSTADITSAIEAEETPLKGGRGRPETKPEVAPSAEEEPAGVISDADSGAMADEAAETVPAAAAAMSGKEAKEDGSTDFATLSGHETILFIEEDPDTRSSIEEILNSFGYNALPARNWVEGVNLFNSHSQVIDLVLVNILVPEMVWVKTVMDLQRITEELRIGLMGSSERTPTIERYLDMDGVTLLHKPFTTASLLEDVRAALDKEEG